MLHTYKDLIVWQKSMELVTQVYLLTGKFPRGEQYILAAQMRRAAISIPSNIAEGRLRGSKNEYRQFLFIAYGSGGELETQIEISKRLFVTKNLDYTLVQLLLEEIMKMLNKLISNLSLKPKA